MNSTTTSSGSSFQGFSQWTFDPRQKQEKTRFNYSVPYAEPFGPREDSPREESRSSQSKTRARSQPPASPPIYSFSRPQALLLLGFSRTATPTAKEILQAFRRKAHEVHPDKGGTNQAMKDLLQARKLLLDPLARSRTE